MNHKNQQDMDAEENEYKMTDQRAKIILCPEYWKSRLSYNEPNQLEQLAQDVVKEIKSYHSHRLEDESQLKRLYDWIMDENRQKANTAFTASELRNVAREIEYRLKRLDISEQDIEEMSKNYSDNPMDQNAFYSGVKAMIQKIKDSKMPFRKYELVMMDENRENEEILNWLLEQNLGGRIRFVYEPERPITTIILPGK